MQLVIPSVDILHGNAVRLRQGRLETAGEFGDPVELAAKYDALGFQLIHLVDLDAAFGGSDQFAILEKIAGKCMKAKLQWGGGLRNIELASQALSSGAYRVIFSTAIFENPEGVAAAAAKFGKQRVAAGLDFKGKIARVKGWKEGTGLDVEQAISLAEKCGVGRIVVTSVEADGMQKGPDLGLLRQAADATSLPVIASGGMRNAKDALDASRAGAGGAIFGRALYGREVDLEELACLQSE